VAEYRHILHRRIPQDKPAGNRHRCGFPHPAGLAYCHHTPDRPLAAYLAPPDDPGGPARRVRTGAVAGLVLLHVPLASALAASDAGLVRAVLIDGSLITGA
jgi:hypothetical protein